MRKMAISIRNVIPVRTCDKKYKSYTSFKAYIRDDFNKRCGYCDDSDTYSGGKRGFHIDHFRPHSLEKFAELKETYSNLVYSCSYCNGAKSNKWEDTNGFIDPCASEYDEHIVRNEMGQIEYTTKRGEYIHTNLKLGLKRHEFIWIMGSLKKQAKEIDLRIEQLGCGHEDELKLLRILKSIQVEVKEYAELFEDTL